MENKKFIAGKYSIGIIVFYTFLVINIYNGINFAQNKIEIFPSNLLIKPFTSNTLKPKLGFEFK